MKDMIRVELPQLHDDNIYMLVYIGNQLIDYKVMHKETT